MSENKRKNILIISANFPPSAAVGGKRFGGLSKIFQEEYYNVHILTLKEKYFLQKDKSLHSGGNIHRTGMYPPWPVRRNNVVKRIFCRVWENYFCVFEPFSGWILPGLIEGLKIIKRYKIDVIIATGPPFSSMVMALMLTWFTGVKLILDYRDQWTTYKRRIYQQILGGKINPGLEKLVVSRSSALVFCSDIMKENFIKRFGNHTKGHMYVVNNGFYYRKDIKPLYLEKNKKTILYAGNFYGQRRLSLLAQPIANLLRQEKITKDDFCVHIFGELNGEDRNVVEEYDLAEIIKEHPLVDYELILRYMKGADILFLPSGANVSYAIPFKFYDYLSVKRPILAVAPEDSAVAKLMNEIDCGHLALIDNQVSVQNILQNMLLEEKKYTFKGVEKYTWNSIGEKYRMIINELV